MTDTRRHWLTAGGAMLVLVIAGLAMGMAGSTAAQSADIVVAADGSAEYTSIQHAVDNASNTARIEIEAGTYDQDVDVYKNVTIDAPNGATISNGSAVASADGLRIAGDASPTVSGVTLTGWSDGINAYQSTGDWAVVDATVTNIDDGVDASDSTGDWRIEGTTIENTDSQAILTTDSAGDWVVTETTIATTGRAGVVPYGSSGNWTVSSTTIRDSAEDGIDAGRVDTGHIQNVSVTDVAGHGIITADTDGDWRIEDTTVRGAKKTAILAPKLNASSDPTIQNVSVSGADRGIDVSLSKGDWNISNSDVMNIKRSGVLAADSEGDGTIQQLTVSNASSGVNFYNSSGEWTVSNATISQVGEYGFDVSYSSGDWHVQDTTVRNASRGGIVTVGSTGAPVIENTMIRNVIVGINIRNATDDWIARNVTVQDAEAVGIYANGTTGDWLVTDSSLTNIGIVALQAGKTEGRWQINESIITSGNTNATGARGADIEGNASYNYWGAADGPSGTLNGSGGKVRGNLEVTPFYTDASLTTVSSKIGNDSDSGSQNNSTGFVDVAASDLDGSGTEADPYVITNASELQAMEDDLNAHYELNRDIDASGTVRWNNGKGFDPINTFNGTLIGNGQKIESISIDRELNAGLFAINGKEGVITNLHLKDANVTAREVGGLAMNNNGEIRNSSVNGKMASKIVSGNNVGGLVDENRGVIISSNVSGTVTGGTGVGGLVGDNKETGVIKNSYVTADVTAKNNNVGGLVGANGGIIMNSSTTATVRGNLTDGFNAGGLVGINGKTNTKGVVNKSYSLGDVEGDTYVGGLVGRNSNGSIDESYAVGTVEGNNGLGGFAGRNSGSITNSYWDTDSSRRDTSDGGTGLTTSEMIGSAAEMNMVGFEFGTAWETKQNDYPALIETDTPTTTQVQLSNVQLQPDTVGSSTNHTLSFTMSGVSADGQTDTVSITLPDSVTVVNVSNARSTDTPYDVSVTSQENPIELAVNPDDAAGTVSLDIEVALRLKTDGI